MTAAEREALESALSGFYSKIGTPMIDLRDLDAERNAGYDLAAAIRDLLYGDDL
jgi:hypothetical protein